MLRWTNQTTLFESSYILILLASLIALVVYQRLKLNRLKALIEARDSEVAQLTKDNELLRVETQHRVKNNMQIISSLLSLQDRNASNEKAKEALVKSKNRVKSIALIHQRLYNEARPGHFSAQEYIKSLSSSIFNAYKVDKGRVKLKTEIDDLLLHVDTGIPVGLILNELLSNCLKYAFTESDMAEITVRLRELDKKLILEVEDNGTSLSPEELTVRVGSFGNKMIETFGKKLDSSLELSSDGPNKVRLEISNYQVQV